MPACKMQSKLMSMFILGSTNSQPPEDQASNWHGSDDNTQKHTTLLLNLTGIMYLDALFVSLKEQDAIFDQDVVHHIWKIQKKKW